jgi:hypothetical protein
MKTIRIYGASDDGIVVNGDINEEFEANGGGTLLIVSQPSERKATVDGLSGTFLPDAQAGLYVHGVFGLDETNCGCWGFSVHQLEADTPLPDWDIKLLAETESYSAILELELPDDAEIMLVGADEDED